MEPVPGKKGGGQGLGQSIPLALGNLSHLIEPSETIVEGRRVGGQYAHGESSTEGLKTKGRLPKDSGLQPDLTSL